MVRLVPSTVAFAQITDIYFYILLVHYDRNILRVLAQNPVDQINLLLSKEDSESTYVTQVQSLLSTTGTAHAHRSGLQQTCHKSGDQPLILTTKSDPVQSVVLCVDPSTHISSALVPDEPNSPPQLSSFSSLEHHQHPVLLDVGLAAEGVFLAKLSDGSAIVFQVSLHGALKSLWTFDPTVSKSNPHYQMEPLILFS
ncbi:hypothetical protein Pst134EA_015480 [Puccinia striiformis f. sp. tritici]|uniref:hypothetical protein n=1 Tax=Puccinia striiformis f. sp. tritici TaxID=168172 RepID=UPI0020072BAC|nr:hypothetical protein Pst134EA_015480 [Puccinia striiformis f. sp. tritici]KAH9463394.1 hypothetical protein Pst134EA_015480 [Puccinia striiformis f. sp. tritici]